MSWVVYGIVWFIVWVVCLWLVWRMVGAQGPQPGGLDHPHDLLPDHRAHHRGDPAGQAAADAARDPALTRGSAQYLPSSFQMPRWMACPLKPGLLYMTAQWLVMTLRPRFSASASASGVSVIWWIQTRCTPASAALATHAAVSSLGSSSTAASTGPGSSPKSA